MDANDFYDLKVRRAKNFGFPEPIFINAEKLTNKSRVLYTVEVQATHIPDKDRQRTHHYSLKFCKFKKIKEEPFWTETELTTTQGFSVADRASTEKLAAYIKANETLLGIDISSHEYTSALLSNDRAGLELVRQVLASERNKQEVYELFKEHYPELDKKILTYKLVQARRKALEEFKQSIDDEAKKERNYWQPFLEKNRWMFGLSYFVLLDENRVDLWDTADYLFESEDGFIDIVEIKHPHLPFWEYRSDGHLELYRGFIQPSEDLKGAVTQATNYIFQVEKKFHDPDWQRKNKCDTPVKPKCTVILGRSKGWDIDKRTAYRLLNDSLHGVEIITFDHLYSRAEKLLDSLEKEA